MTPGPHQGDVRRGSGFAGRLLLAQALVLGAGAATTWAVATAVGPAIFHTHLRRAQVPHTDAEARHVEQAFNSALLLSISVAVVTSVAAALLVSWYFTRRVRGSIAAVSQGASGIAAGRYDARVPDPGLGAEFTTLAASYNQLAERLGATETTRRRLLSNLAHELRTPLTTIDAHVEAIEDGVRQADHDTLGVIRSSTRRIRLLAEDLSALSRAEEGGLPLDVHVVTARSLAEAGIAAAAERFRAADVELTLAASTDARVQVDTERIGQVLGNLLDNALRHTPAGGRVTVTVERDGAEVTIAVADDGDGIAAEHLDHVFERFYRTDTARDRDHGGSGIGLSIARALVESLDGSLTAASDGPGAGAMFTLRLPLAT